MSTPGPVVCVRCHNNKMDMVGMMGDPMNGHAICRGCWLDGLRILRRPIQLYPLTCGGCWRQPPFTSNAGTDLRCASCTRSEELETILAHVPPVYRP